MALTDLKPYSKDIDLPSGRIRYYEAGSGDNHTILLHGMGVSTSADTFANVFEPLAQNFHIYNMDMFGFGHSSREMGYGPTFETIIDGIRQFMDAKGIEQANIVGHSAGGWFGAILAYESPQRLRRLVMIGSAGMNVTPVPNVSNPAPTTMERALATTMASVGQGASSWTEEMAKDLAGRMLEAGTLAPNSLAPLLQQMANAEIRNHWLIQWRLPHITTPTLVIWGKGDTMEPYPTWTAEWDTIGGDVSKSSKPWVIPGAKYVLLDAGHNSHWEQPETITELVTDFLK